MAKQKISCGNIQFLVLVAGLTGRLGIDACQQRVNEQGQIAFAITQRRELKYSDRQAVEEVLPKSAAPNLFRKHAIGCSYDSDVDRLGHTGTHAGDLALLLLKPRRPVGAGAGLGEGRGGGQGHVEAARECTQVPGLLGVGGGILMVPAFTIWIGIPLRQTIATSLMTVGVLAVPGTVTCASDGVGDPSWAVVAVAWAMLVTEPASMSLWVTV